MSTVKIVHFSDVLCIWAYGGEANLFRLVKEFGPGVSMDVHHCSVFPDTQTKMDRAWGQRGGYEGYGRHVREAAARFDDLTIHPDTWSRVRPRSSASPHLCVKAIELLEASDPAALAAAFSQRPSIKAAKELRRAFFADARDISNWKEQRTVCDRIGVDFDAVLEKIETGEAIARLAADYDLAQSSGVRGSPTYLMNDGRQKLYGNVSYGILAANVAELISDDGDVIASPCS